MSDVHDFDSMFSEDVEETGHKYRLFGVEGEIPPKIPYGIVLMYQRMSRDDTDVDGNIVHEMLERIFGPDVVNAWAENPKFDVDKMMKVFQWAMSKYNLSGEDKEEKKPSRGKLKVLRSETS